MRREKVDPAEKLFNVFAQKVKKGRLWPPAGNEVEKVVSNLHFSSSHLIGHPHQSHHWDNWRAKPGKKVAQYPPRMNECKILDHPNCDSDSRGRGG